MTVLNEMQNLINDLEAKKLEAEKVEVIGSQEFMGREIPVIEGGFGEGKRCLTDKTVADIHNQPVYKIRERINDNIRRFKRDVDFIDLKQRILHTDTLEKSDLKQQINQRTDTINTLLSLGYSKQSITQAEHIYLLSERGYAKLIKIMDTDLAWEIHDQLIDEYFSMRASYENPLPKLDDFLVELISQLPTPQVKRIVNKLNGKLLPPKPVVETLYDFLKENMQYLSCPMCANYTIVNEKLFYDYFERHGYNPSDALTQLYEKNLVEPDIFGMCVRGGNIRIKMTPSLEFYESN